MERRTASHTEEEELNQRRRLLNLARKGDPKAISRLFELYQVRVYSGDKLGKARLPSWPSMHQKTGKPAVQKRTPARRPARHSNRAASRPARVTRRARRLTARKPSRRTTHR